MTPARNNKPAVGALRAARAIQRDASLLKSLPELIDRETGVREILEILENIIAKAGDLIETRSPELVAQARRAPAFQRRSLTPGRISSPIEASTPQQNPTSVKPKLNSKFHPLAPGGHDHAPAEPAAPRA